MGSHMGGDPSVGQLICPSRPPANKPSRLNDLALRALPFISILVGIDELCPTKAVYAIYDISVASLRFVHGDGVFVIPEQICFMNTFKNGLSQLGFPQRVYFLELLQRSAKFYQLFNSKDPNAAAALQRQYPNINTVKSALTYYSDLRFGPGETYPALKTIPMPEQSESFQDQGLPCVLLSVNPIWNFDPSIDFHPRIRAENETELRSRHMLFMETYKSLISWHDFQHALFCLSGLEKAKQVTFIQRSQNNPLYFVPGVTPPLPPKNVLPLRTTGGWTVDCFIARFANFENFLEGLNLVQVPNPIFWLEAVLEDELRRQDRGTGYQVMRPWKGTVNGDRVDQVMNWEILAGLEWTQREGCYPRPFVAPIEPVLLLDDLLQMRQENLEKIMAAREERRSIEAAARTFIPGASPASSGMTGNLVTGWNGVATNNRNSHTRQIPGLNQGIHRSNTTRYEYDEPRPELLRRGSNEFSQDVETFHPAISQPRQGEESNQHHNKDTTVKIPHKPSLSREGGTLAGQVEYQSNSISAMVREQNSKKRKSAKKSVTTDVRMQESEDLETLHMRRESHLQTHHKGQPKAPKEATRSPTARFEPGDGDLYGISDKEKNRPRKKKVRLRSPKSAARATSKEEQLSRTREKEKRRSSNPRQRESRVPIDRELLKADIFGIFHSRPSPGEHEPLQLTTSHQDELDYSSPSPSLAQNEFSTPRMTLTKAGSDSDIEDVTPTNYSNHVRNRNPVPRVQSSSPSPSGFEQPSQKYLDQEICHEERYSTASPLKNSANSPGSVQPVL